MSFQNFQKQLAANFKKLSEGDLFYIEIDREQVWERYLAGFPDEDKQSNTCNCCKAFLRQHAGIVAIKNNDVVSIWDGIKVDDEYAGALEALRTYIHSLPVTDIFLNPFKVCGTEKNLDIKRNVVWNHFNLTLPNQFVSSSADTKKGEARTAKDMLKRALTDLKAEATETVLELIDQNTLYRGTEFEGLLKAFLKLQQEFNTVSEFWQDNFCWVKSRHEVQVARIRNSAIGTLLINLSEGMELEAAVKKYETVVAPTNYKRPTALALVTPKMIEQAKQTLQEAGLLDSIYRRYATEADLNINNVLWSASSDNPFLDPFAELSKETLVNPKSLKPQEVSIEDFISKVLPQTKNLEVLFENRQQANLVSLITAQNENAPSLFKWDDNKFSWSYADGVTDSIKQRVAEKGGKVDGVLRFSIQWNENGKNNIDFDAHALEPNDNEIYFRNYKKPNVAPSSGNLDVDVINPNGEVAVENITWSKLQSMKCGMYKFWVHNYSGSTSKGGFKAQIEFNGEIHDFEYGQNLKSNENVYVAEVVYSKGGFTIKSLLDSKTTVNSLEKWNLKTYQFHKVSKVMLSPNHWQSKIGNKHWFFMLENCRNSEKARPFFNEFLKQELDLHKKVFEMLAGKVEVPESTNQVSGLGFSSTQPNSLIVRTDNKNLQINF